MKSEATEAQTTSRALRHRLFGIEDSLAGIISAKGAGMWAVGIPNTYTTPQLFRQGPMMSSRDLGSLTPEWIDRRFALRASPADNHHFRILIRPFTVQRFRATKPEPATGQECSSLPRWPDQPIRIALVITDLNVGGAERALVSLAIHLDQNRWQPAVFCLGKPGPLVDVLASGRMCPANV